MDSQQARIRFLLHNYLNNKCTVEELEELFEFIRQHPDNKILSSMIDTEAHEQDMPDRLLPEEVSHSILLSLNKRLAGRDYVYEKIQRRFVVQHYLKLAAVFLVAIACTAVLYFYFAPHKARYIEEKTAFGQIREIRLPDSSTVVLNGNSSIRYREDWNDRDDRTVFLTGEGFFKVVHLPNHKKFSVRTNSQVTVEVLGTEFNVKDRRDRTQVVLQSGKIKLNIASVALENRNILMTTGEYAEVRKGSETITRKSVDSNIYTSWRDHKIVFNNTPLSDILHLLEDNYGIVSIVHNDRMLKEKFTAIYPSDNISILLKALEKSFDIKYEKETNRLNVGTP